MDAVGNVTTLTSLEQSSRIMWIAYFWNRIKLYVNLNRKDSYVLFYDPNADASNDIIRYRWKVFISMVSDWRFDRVLTKKCLYLSWWSDLTPIKKNPGWFTYTGTRSSGNPHPMNAMAMDEDLCYFLADDWVMSAWNYHVWYPKAVYKQRYTSTKPTCIQYASLDDILYIGQDKRVKKAESWYQASWNLEHKVYIWNGMYEEKNQEPVFVGYKLDSWDSIEVYMNNDDRYFVFDVSWITTSPKDWDIYSNNSSQFTVRQAKITSWSWQILTEKTTWTNNPSTSWTLVRVSWSWDANITYSARSYYELVRTITDSTARFDLIYCPQYNKTFNYQQLKVVLKSATWATTPRLYEITPLYSPRQA
jgi:hypothetical protein